MSHGWTEFDTAHAYTQGWGLFNHGLPEIQRLDDTSERIFSCDEEAKVFVLERAGSDIVCRKAIKICYGI